MAEPESQPDKPAIGAAALATVWFTLFLDLVGFGLILPVLPFYAEHHGASASQVTLLSTTFSAAQFVMSPVLGRLSDRIGRRPVMLVSIGGSIGAMLLLATAQSLWMVFAARLLSGICNSNVSTANAYVADKVAPKDRARYMGMMGSAIGVGFVAGPALGGLLFQGHSSALPFFTAAGLAAINFLMAFIWLKESGRPRTQERSRRPLFVFTRANLRQVAGTPLGWILVVNFCYFGAFAAMESTFALFSEHRLGWNGRDIGYMFAAIGLVIAVQQGLVLGRLVARIGERGTLLIGMTILAAGLLLAGAATQSVQLVVGGLLIAAGNGLNSPSINAVVSRLSNADEQGLNLGLSSSAAALARTIAPIGAGLLFEHISPGTPMMLAAGSVVLALLLVWARVRLPAADD